MDRGLYWITGLSGAGKTTIGNKLYYEIKKECSNVILLDGDIVKKVVGEQLGYSLEDRKERARRYARLCKMLVDQGMIVICCTIAMFDEVRQWNRDNISNYVEVFLDVPLEILKERDQKGMYSKYDGGKISNLVGMDLEVEFPKMPDLIIRNDGSKAVKDCVQQILAIEVSVHSDTAYWNDYYNKGSAVATPSLFAKFVYNYIKESCEGRKIIDLGCGNGRDSKFFAENGLYVTGIDLSERAIQTLKKETENIHNIEFICDDFVSARTIFQQRFDYCYSRFTIHAITEKQQNELLDNVYVSLNEGGLFFIEVRSVRDDIYGKGEQVERNAFIYNEHYRRFLVREELERELLSRDFEMVMSKEEKDFAPFGDSNPYIIRVVARKRKQEP